MACSSYCCFSNYSPSLLSKDPQALNFTQQIILLTTNIFGFISYFRSFLLILDLAPITPFMTRGTFSCFNSWQFCYTRTNPCHALASQLLDLLFTVTFSIHFSQTLTLTAISKILSLPISVQQNSSLCADPNL